MVTTILAVVALAGSHAPSAKPLPAWQTDYSQALASATAERKPMAVFIGQGAERFGRMMEDGTIPAEAAKVLRESYVVVYLDATTAAGKDLATRYSMPEGLVINNASGNVQALRHSGAVAGPGLTTELTRYASVAPVATTTIASPVVQTGAITSGVPAIVSGNCPGGNCRNVVSTGYTLPTQSFPLGQPVAAPGAYSLPSAPSFPFGGVTSSCPNGRCPNQR